MQGLPVHLDGARMFNAAAALGCPVSDITRHVSSVQFCLSKVRRNPAICFLDIPLPTLELEMSLNIITVSLLYSSYISELLDMTGDR